MIDARHLRRSLVCTQCRQRGHTEVDCNWLVRIGVDVRAATAPAPGVLAKNKRKNKAHRGGKGNKARKKARSAAKKAARKGGKDLRKEAEAEASGGEGPAPASPEPAHAGAPQQCKDTVAPGTHP
ncbi:hypothetical protein N7501_000237 [Penicillium viridicatum]|nr:hypothetical protein N7501_000237 [Penicillium viridicatum]